MANELNALLTDAAARCARLSGQMDDALEGVEGMQAGADAVGELIEEGVSDVRAALVALTERLDEARGQVVEARGESQRELDAAAEKAAAVTSSINDLEDAVTNGADSLEAAVTEARSTLSQKLAATTASFDALGEKASEVQKDTTENLQKAQDAFQAFVDGAKTEQDGLNDRTEAWADALNELSEEGTRQVNEAVEAMAGVLLGPGRSIFGMGNEMISDHNEAMDALKARFVDGGEQALDGVLNPLKAELAVLSRLADTRRNDLGEKAQAALTRIEALLPELQEMTATLQKAERL